jgi:hypothetical protein
MQNPDTGRLEEISSEIADRINKGDVGGLFHKDGSPVKKDVAMFHVGQIVEVNGGKFKVRKITKKDIILRGVPR